MQEKGVSTRKASDMKVKAIGVSNFDDDLFNELLEWSKVTPHIVQDRY